MSIVLAPFPRLESLNFNANGDTVSFGKGAAIDDLWNISSGGLNAVALIRLTSTAGGQILLAKKATSTGTSAGWVIQTNSTLGAMNVRLGAATTALSYTTVELPLAVLNQWVWIGFGLDKNLGTGLKVVIYTYRLCDNKLTVCTFSAPTEGTGALTSDASQNYRLADSDALNSVGKTDTAFAMLYQGAQMSVNDFLDIIRAPQDWKGRAAHWCSVGQYSTGLQVDESGNGTMLHGTVAGAVRPGEQPPAFPRVLLPEDYGPPPNSITGTSSALAGGAQASATGHVPATGTATAKAGGPQASATGTAPGNAPIITLTPATTYQVMEGILDGTSQLGDELEYPAGNGGGADAVSWANYNGPLITQVVGEFGLKALGLGLYPGCQRGDSVDSYATGLWNSGGPPQGRFHSVTGAVYYFTYQQHKLDRVVLPIRAALGGARKLFLPSIFNPGNRANSNFVQINADDSVGTLPDLYVAFFTWMMGYCGFTPDQISVNEPDLTGWSPAAMAAAFAAVYTALVAAGPWVGCYTGSMAAPSIAYPSVNGHNSSAQGSQTGQLALFFDAAFDGSTKPFDLAGITASQLRISRHNYNDLPNNRAVEAARCTTFPTLGAAMTEFQLATSAWDIFTDLTNGPKGVSRWEDGGTASQHNASGGGGDPTRQGSYYDVDTTVPAAPVIVPTYFGRYWRHLSFPVSLGATRFRAVSNDTVAVPNVIAFVNPDGTHAIIGRTAGTKGFSITAAKAGVYHRRYTTGDGSHTVAPTAEWVDLGDITVAIGDPIPMQIPNAGIGSAWQDPASGGSTTGTGSALIGGVQAHANGPAPPPSGDNAGDIFLYSD